jgi:hypothetical protein
MFITKGKGGAFKLLFLIGFYGKEEKQFEKPKEL